jgi:predicted homoserine dehydrogenase-like protein
VTREGKPVFRDLRWGVYVTFAADSEYVRRCFAEYGLVTDESGNYAAMYKPYHLIGLELGVSVASVGLRGEPTGRPDAFRADAVAVAKRDLRAGDVLDGEGGYTVYGRLMPAERSLAIRALPIGLAHGLRVTRPVPRHAPLTWEVVEAGDSQAVKVRQQMERHYSPAAVT